MKLHAGLALALLAACAVNAAVAASEPRIDEPEVVSGEALDARGRALLKDSHRGGDDYRGGRGDDDDDYYDDRHNNVSCLLFCACQYVVCVSWLCVPHGCSRLLMLAA